MALKVGQLVSARVGGTATRSGRVEEQAENGSWWPIMNAPPKVVPQEQQELTPIGKPPDGIKHGLCPDVSQRTDPRQGAGEYQKRRRG